MKYRGFAELLIICILISIVMIKQSRPMRARGLKRGNHRAIVRAGVYAGLNAREFLLLRWRTAGKGENMV